MRKRRKPHASPACAAGIGCALMAASWANAVVFKDDFNRADSTTIGTISGPGTSTWTETNTGDGNIAIGGNLLTITHGAADGPSYISAPTSGFAAGWSNTLSANEKPVTWAVNMQSSRTTNLSGFLTNENGIAVVLAGTNATFTLGDGYALLWGQSSTPDPLRLVRYTGGVDGNSNLTNIITATSTPFSDVANQYLSLQVSYTAATNTWELFGRNDGALAFADPSSGLSSIGPSAVDATYVNSTIAAVGIYGQYTALGASNIYRFDNFSIAVPEPASLSPLAIGAWVLMRRRRA